MGKRIHVIKKQEEYGDFEAFNWKQEEFFNLLSSLDCYLGGTDDYSYDRVEIFVPEYEIAINYLKDIRDGKTEFENIDILQVQEALDALNYGIDDVINYMEKFYEERDRSSDYIMFVSW